MGRPGDPIDFRNGRRLTKSWAHVSSEDEESHDHDHDRDEEDDIAGFERLCTPNQRQDPPDVQEENDSGNEANHTSTIGDGKAVAISRSSANVLVARRHPVTAPYVRQRKEMILSSRRTLPSKQAGVTVACGWDNPLQTYFCTVLREPLLIEEDADPVVLWLGLDHREVRTPEEMAAPLAPYANLDAQIIRLLRADRGEDLDRGPTALQRESLAAFKDRVG